MTTSGGHGQPTISNAETAQEAQLAAGRVGEPRHRRVKRRVKPLGSARSADVVVPPLPELRPVEVPGRGTTAVRFAAGPTPVLLLHGWAVTADFNFCHLMDPLARRFGVVAVDHCGHGRGLPVPDGERFSITQCADDAAAVLDGLGIDRVVVCGYSLGGPVAMELVRRHRNRVAGLVLESTTLAFENRRDKMARLMFRALRPLADRSRGVGRSLPLHYYNRIRAGDRQTVAWWPWLCGELVGCHPRVLVDVILAEYAFDFRPWVGALAGLPTTVVMTTRDRAVPPRAQRDMARLLDAPVIELDSDHDVFLSQPASYVHATLAAIESVGAQS